MSITILGLNHKTAPIAIRERVAFGADIIVGALRNLLQQSAITEGLILSTCNRTEIYSVLDTDSKTPLTYWLTQFHGLAQEQLTPYLYTYSGRDAVEHLLTVACGLDSMVLGEPQILGQVKQAFHVAHKSQATGKLLSRLFQHCLKVAKQVRTDTAIGNSPVSVAFAAIDLARQIFSSLSQQTALLIGAGETIELVARYLKQHNINRIIVANRTVERAHILANQMDGFAIALPEIATHLAEADIIISSTASPLPVLGKGTVERALKKRKHRPMLMLDLAVPRDIEPEVVNLSDVYLYTVDDLQEVVAENQRSRQEAAHQAQEIIEFHTDEFMGWLRSLGAVTLIQKYRHQAEAIRDTVLDRAKHSLNQGRDPEEVLHYLAYTLTNKLLHHPSAKMRRAGIEGQQELLIAANELLQINSTEPSITYKSNNGPT
ncbi:glutamyl-tRNA reductase [Achromatium sp. WMS3]|nr:glutamyl-tRNA reductase [Achromatium sp. WMS3]